MFEKAVALMPFYLNGTLAADERAWLITQLSLDARLRAELELLTQMAAQVKTHAARAPESIGLAAVLARIERENAPRFWQRWSGAVEHWMKPALFACVAIIGVQSWLLNRPAQPLRYRGAEPAQQLGTTAGTVHLAVIFVPSISEAEMRVLLAGIGAQIVAGPGAGGEYTLALSTDQLTAAKTQLEASGMTESVRPQAFSRP